MKKVCGAAVCFIAASPRGIPGRTVRDAKRELGDALKSKIVEDRKKVFWME